MNWSQWDYCSDCGECGVFDDTHDTDAKMRSRAQDILRLL